MSIVIFIHKRAGIIKRMPDLIYQMLFFSSKIFSLKNIFAMTSK